MPYGRYVTGGGGIGGGYPNLTGSAPYDYDPAYGGKPQTPDPSVMAKMAADANAANMGSYLNLAKGINEYTYQDYMNQIRRGNPLYDQQVGQFTGMTSDQLAGMVPRDVQNQVTQFGAERGIGTGLMGSPANNAAMLKAFYDTSTAQQAKGAANYLNFQGSIPHTPTMDITKLMTDPNKMYEAWMQANMMAAAPVPREKAMAELGAAQSGINSGKGGYSGGGITLPVGNPAADILNRYRPTATASPSPAIYGGWQESAPPPESSADWYSRTYGRPPGSAPGTTDIWTQQDEEDMNEIMYGGGSEAYTPTGDIGDWGNPYWNPNEPYGVGAF